MSWKEYGLDSYPEYLNSAHWRNLKKKYIYTNKQAQCFISHRKDNLLLHHVHYGALYQEKLNNDVYILSYDYHDLVHFWLFRLIKVPLRPNWLLFSMRLRRLIFCIQSHQFGLSLLWFLTIVLVLIWNIAVSLSWTVLKTAVRLLYLILKYLLALK